MAPEAELTSQLPGNRFYGLYILRSIIVIVTVKKHLLKPLKAFDCQVSCAPIYPSLYTTSEREPMSLKNGTGLDFVSTHPFVKATLQDKIRGVIFGSALGDCIGLYTGWLFSPTRRVQRSLPKYLEFLSKKIAEDAYPQGRFQLVDPATKFRNDGHRSELCILPYSNQLQTMTLMANGI